MKRVSADDIRISCRCGKPYRVLHCEPEGWADCVLTVLSCCETVGCRIDAVLFERGFDHVWPMRYEALRLMDAEQVESYLVSTATHLEYGEERMATMRSRLAALGKVTP